MGDTTTNQSDDLIATITEFEMLAARIRGRKPYTDSSGSEFFGPASLPQEIYPQYNEDRTRLHSVVLPALAGAARKRRLSPDAYWILRDFVEITPDELRGGGRRGLEGNATLQKWHDAIALTEELKATLNTANEQTAETKENLSGDVPSATKGKGVAPRNAWFLTQWEARGTDTYHKPAKIQDDWWHMTDKQRAEICPDNPARVSRVVVARGISRARELRDGLPTKPKPKRPRTGQKA
jgi:hypothetical protein